MRKFYIALAATTVVAVALAFSLGAPAPGVRAGPSPSCLAGGGLNISTGTAGIGVLDPTWTVNSLHPLTIAPDPAWLVPPAGKNPHWISAGNNLASNVYNTSFNVPAGVASLSLTFQFAADNNVSFALVDPNSAATQINPVLTGVALNNFNKLHSTVPPTVTVTGNPKLKPGKYALTATVGNVPNSPEGLLVVGNLTCVASPPLGGVAAYPNQGGGSNAGFVLGGSALAALLLGAAAWRMRRMVRVS